MVQSGGRRTDGNDLELCFHPGRAGGRAGQWAADGHRARTAQGRRAAPRAEDEAGEDDPGEPDDRTFRDVDDEPLPGLPQTLPAQRPRVRVIGSARFEDEAAAAAAQLVPDTALTYRREVFEYRRAGRPDPFRSLLRGTDLGVRPEDLTLIGVVYTPNPSGSVAVLTRRGEDHPIRARVGDRIGGIQIVAIRPRGVDILIEEFGIARRATIELKSAAKKGES